MEKTPKGFRLHIGLFGRRNVGKSSLLNAIAGQNVAIVSEVAGTTTDVVEKTMELLPIGPVVFLDTAGMDDLGSLGELRVERTKQVFDRTDLGLVVVARGKWSDDEEKIVRTLKERNIPTIVVFNQTDFGKPDASLLEKLTAEKISFVETVATMGTGIAELRETLFGLVPDDVLTPPPIISDLVPEGSAVILVVPIDKEAPKGRLILPQVQTIRDLLDAGQVAVVCKETELEKTLKMLAEPPALVVTDSQAFQWVDKVVPREIPMTSFSILFARQKGDLAIMVDGATSIANLKPGCKILIAEACTHHAVEDDIGRQKIPAWLRKYVGGDVVVEHCQGHDFSTQTLTDWDLVIHCGACMWNRREILNRMMHCRNIGVPITNYGLSIAFMLGILDRAVEPFEKLKKETILQE